MTAPLPPGSSLGRYRILRPLGSGAMGDVYVAEDPSIGRQLAIKTVRLHGASEREIDERRLRLLREAKAAGRLMHPHAVALFDAGEQDGLVYLAFEFVDGQTLGDRMLSEEPIDTQEALKLAREISSALAAAHAQGVIHRDIKPANILLTRDGSAKVADFGIAKMNAQSTELTTAGTVIGSPQYMSPEQVRGEDLDGRSDQFSLGTVLYELLTRRRAFMGDTITTLVYLILNEEPEPIEELRPDLSPRVTTLVRRMMDKEREARFSSMNEVVEEITQLEKVLAQAIFMPPPPPGFDSAPTVETGKASPAVADTVVADRTPAASPIGVASSATVSTTNSVDHTSASAAPPPKSGKVLLIVALACGLLAMIAVPIGGFLVWKTFLADQTETRVSDKALEENQTGSATAAPGEKSEPPLKRGAHTQETQTRESPSRQTADATTPVASPEEQSGANADDGGNTAIDAEADRLATERVPRTASRDDSRSEADTRTNTPSTRQPQRESPSPRTQTPRTQPSRDVATRTEPKAAPAEPLAEQQRTAPPVVASAAPAEADLEADADQGWGDIQIDQKVVGGNQLFLEVLPKNVAKEAFLQIRGRIDDRFIHAGRFWEYRDSGYAMPGVGPHLVRLRADGYRDWVIEVDVQPSKPATRLSVTLKR